MKSSIGRVIVAAALCVSAAGIVTSMAARADVGEDKKVYVCKYVGKPGVDERLQTGQNPIEVSTHAIENNGWDGSIPGWFSDAQGRSYVIGYVPMNPEPTRDDCPAVDTPSSPPATQSVPPTETSAPPTETTAPPTETTAPPNETTAPPTETSAPPTETTTPPNETTAPPTETTMPPSETKSATPAPTPTQPPTAKPTSQPANPGGGLPAAGADGPGDLTGAATMLLALAAVAGAWIASRKLR